MTERNQQFADAFGISRDEQAQIHGKALGGHLWDGMMKTWGGESGFRNAIRSESYDRIRESGYGAEHIKFDPEDHDAPYVEHKSGPYRARWFGGTYADIHHRTQPDEAIDTLNVGHEAHPDKGSDIQSSLEDWHKEQSHHYR